MATEVSDVERVAKKIRCSNPDLKVVLGEGEDAEFQWHHSQALATKSNYIDAILSTPMKESKERMITFPDITIGAWRKMMLFLDSPLAARRMNIRDALEVASMYDKYDFLRGSELCDAVMADYLKFSTSKMEEKGNLDLDLIIELVNVSHKSNLKAAFKAGIGYVWKKMTSTQTPYGRLMFTESMLTSLKPALIYARDNRESLGLHDIRESRIITGATHTFDGEPFAKEFVSECRKWDEYHLWMRSISHIELSGSTCAADGKFVMEDMLSWDRFKPDTERTATWGGRDVTFRIQYWKKKEGVSDSGDNFEGWAIVLRYPPTEFDEEGFGTNTIRKKCWVVPYSKNYKRPPCKGWVPVDPLAMGKPKMKYFFHESITF